MTRGVGEDVLAAEGADGVHTNDDDDDDGGYENDGGRGGYKPGASAGRYPEERILILLSVCH